eukprot:3822240-Pleurochrysis_carterae.AAC.4
MLRCPKTARLSMDILRLGEQDPPLSIHQRGVPPCLPSQKLWNDPVAKSGYSCVFHRFPSLRQLEHSSYLPQTEQGYPLTYLPSSSRNLAGVGRSRGDVADRAAPRMGARQVRARERESASRACWLRVCACLCARV